MFVNFLDFIFFMPQVRANKKVSLLNFLIITISICYVRFQSLKKLSPNIPITESTYSLNSPYFS